ncbi:MAG TPA: metallophosphoesterase [Luteolibacter sp.]
MKEQSSWWLESGKMLDNHPGLIAAARGVRGFGGGARWMHEAMSIAGWRMPPFRGSGHYAKMGWTKYGICGVLGLWSGAIAAWFGFYWFVPLFAVVAFYATEAQMVFLFPEALLGRRTPWASGRALTVAAGGTWQVMAGVLPIAARMLACGWWRGHGRQCWLRGCLAVVIWHRHVATARCRWVENEVDLPCLEIGPTAPLLLRREKVKQEGHGTFRVLWISDLHWRGTSDAGTLMTLRDLVRREQPDVCILGGDFIDRAKALPLLRLLVRCIVRVSPCVALPGNHDRGSFMNAVPEAIRAAGGHWLPDHGRFILANRFGERLEIVGPGINEPTENVKRVLAAHDPGELNNSPPANGSFVLAGHLHGGQWVFSSKNGKLLPAAWFYRHAWLRRSYRGAEWIVSRGAGDTFPVRWNCPREVVLCEIL